MVNKSLSWFLKVTTLGVSGNDEDDVSRRIVFSNVIFLALPIVYVIFMAIDYQSYLRPFSDLNFDQFVVPIIILGCLSSLWFNSEGLTTLSRVLFLTLWPLLLHLIPLWLLQAPIDYSLAYPFGIVFHGLLIQLMFSHKRERSLFLTFMSANLLALLLAPATLRYFDARHEIPDGLVNYGYYFLDAVLYWLLFNLVMFYILYIIENYIRQINESRLLIGEQKEELNALNQNLEMLVSQRTAQLERQNEKLLRHAYYNAHLLRGPFSTVQGLVQLQQAENLTEADREEIKIKLQQSLQELDDRIHEIQKLVETNQ
jgi:signal transduction histidine kinase